MGSLAYRMGYFGSLAYNSIKLGGTSQYGRKQNTFTAKTTAFTAKQTSLRTEQITFNFTAKTTTFAANKTSLRT